MSQLGEHFKSDDQSRHSEWLRQQRWFVKARQDHERKEHISDRLEDDILSFAAEVIMATETQIEKFKIKLDNYEEATVIALMENQEQLDTVNAQLLAMLERAYVMDDGRRVFKTEDGAQVFDEFANEVTHEELDFDLITSDMPTWEAFSKDKELQESLVAERKQILKFQEKVDHVRDQVADDKITTKELDNLDAELSDAMPPSVKAHLPGFSEAGNAPNAKSAFATNAGPAVTANISVNSTSAPIYEPMG